MPRGSHFFSCTYIHVCSRSMRRHVPNIHKFSWHINFPGRCNFWHNSHTILVGSHMYVIIITYRASDCVICKDPHEVGHLLSESFQKWYIGIWQYLEKSNIRNSKAVRRKDDQPPCSHSYGEWRMKIEIYYSISSIYQAHGSLIRVSTYTQFLCNCMLQLPSPLS